MQSENEPVLCPLCHGHGRDRKELMVVRWRSREFEDEMQRMCDEAAFGSGGGLEVPFEPEAVTYSNESD